MTITAGVPTFRSYHFNPNATAIYHSPNSSISTTSRVPTTLITQTSVSSMITTQPFLITTDHNGPNRNIAVHTKSPEEIHEIMENHGFYAPNAENLPDHRSLWQKFEDWAHLRGHRLRGEDKSLPPGKEASRRKVTRASVVGEDTMPKAAVKTPPKHQSPNVWKSIKKFVKGAKKILKGLGKFAKAVFRMMKKEKKVPKVAVDVDTRDVNKHMHNRNLRIGPPYAERIFPKRFSNGNEQSANDIVLPAGEPMCEDAPDFAILCVGHSDETAKLQRRQSEEEEQQQQQQQEQEQREQQQQQEEQEQRGEQAKESQAQPYLHMEQQQLWVQGGQQRQEQQLEQQREHEQQEQQQQQQQDNE